MLVNEVDELLKDVQASLLQPLVSIVKCSEYEREAIFEAVRASLESIGGLRRFVRSGDRVHIKPNLLSAKPPEQAVTTHPLVVEAVVEEVKAVGGMPFIGDSPAGTANGVEHCWLTTGMLGVAERTGAKLVSFEKGGVVKRQINGKTYYIARPVAEADVVINLPKLKTHSLTLFTGAVKNLFGTIPGLKKGEFHKLAPQPQEFSQILVDIFSITKPTINLMDAVIGMEGNGPSSGNPRKIGLILASTDAVALDAVAARIIGFKDKEIATTVIAWERGLGEKDLNRIEIVGEELELVAVKDFSLPSNYFLTLIPKFFNTFLGRLIWVRPRVISELCTRCGECIRNCPVGAMRPVNKFPIINYDKCINCLCCDEICPFNAVEQEMSWLARRLG